MTITVETLTLASIYVLFALGLSLAWGVGKVLNLAHGAVFSMAGLVVYWLTRGSSLPLPVLILCAALMGGVITLTVDTVFFRYIRRQAESQSQIELGQMVCSLGLGAVLITYAQNASQETAQALPQSVGSGAHFTLFGTRIQMIDVIIVCVAFGLSGILAMFVKYSSFGRALRAVAYDPAASEILGINTQFINGATMFLSGSLAGVAAALLSAQTLIYDPTIGQSYLLKGFAIVVLGGAGSLIGTLVGGIVLGLAEVLTTTYISDVWATTAAFVIIVIVMLVRPRGLFGMWNSTRA